MRINLQQALRCIERMDPVAGIRPNPTRFKPPTNGAEPPRSLGCPRHSSCLTAACLAGWPGMSCKHCGIHQQHAAEIALAEARVLLEESIDRRQQSSFGDIRFVRYQSLCVRKRIMHRVESKPRPSRKILVSVQEDSSEESSLTVTDSLDVRGEP